MTEFDGGQFSRPQYLSLSLICGHAPPPPKLGGHKTGVVLSTIPTPCQENSLTECPAMTPGAFHS